MDAERWRKVKEVLDAALSTEREHWAALLDSQCAGDPELRQQVVSLLGGLDEARTFLAAPPAALAAALIHETEENAPRSRYEGRRLGAYRLMREVGRGGMSRVFLAERADGQFEHQVAVKLLRAGFDSDVDVERFRAERQVLASLNHASIARLIDGGVTDEGLPYLVLEYVDGEPVDRYCKLRSLTIKQRLEVFLSVAEAVHHAHLQGIVHRDLKPSNILVTPTGLVKLLDFGLAKMLEQGVTGEAPSTRTGFRWMTPEYAAPEQIRGDTIVPATDVYQLGAVLYQLLAARTPFGARNRSLHELEMATLNLEPETLAAAVGTDLNAIVQKALRKSTEERYASALDFAEDIRRYLGGRPVHARRLTIPYRARRFVIRNRIQLAGTAFSALLAGAMAVVVAINRGWFSSGPGQSVAVVEAGDLTRNLLVTLDTTRAFDSTAARSMVLRGVAKARELAREPAAQAALLDAAGRVYSRLGESEPSIALLQEALVVRSALNGAAQRSIAPPSAPKFASRKLLFVRPGDVYMMDPDGSNEIRITNSPQAWNNDPAWAPDSSRILLSRDVAGAHAIFIMNADGSGMTQVTAPPPGWRDDLAVPLGSRIIFCRRDGRGGGRLYAVNVDGTDLRPVTPGPNDDDPAPSPRDNVLVYRGGNDIYVLDLASGAVKRLTNTPAVYKAGLAVSPDGSQIVFTRIDSGRFEQIFIMNVDGTNMRRVSRGDHYDFLPRWSPDGKRIAFTSQRDGSNGVYSMRLDGSDVRDLSRTPASLAMRPGRNVLQVNETLWAWMKY
jgi:hypothetical protein